MSDLTVALVAAGAALAGSSVTGLFATLTARQQAAAALKAAEHQAAAQMDHLVATQKDQLRTRLAEQRRRVYGTFIERYEALSALHMAAMRRPAGGSEQQRSDDRAAQLLAWDRVKEAAALVSLEGPEAVGTAALFMADHLGRDEDEVHTFLQAAREALE